MAPKIWMWEVPMMPKDPTPAQGDSEPERRWSGLLAGA